jgi:DNA (cytosine-5)-methyltransferase 1
MKLNSNTTENSTTAPLLGMQCYSQPFRILNLYAGIGGNRKLWSGNIQVTAVENDPEIAELYKKHFPQDTVIVGDAHLYLLEHYNEYDFVWSSFPCTTHTRMNINFNIVRFPDLGLYQEIIFLKHYFKGKFCVENVIPYYGNEGLIIPGLAAQQHNRHLFWCNFKIQTTDKRNPPKQIQNIIAQNTKRKRKTYDGNIVNIKASQPHFGFDLSTIKIKTRKDKILRNCVDPEIGKEILERAMNIIKKSDVSQSTLFG